MFINKETNSSYNFKAPEISADADKVVEVPFPTAEKQTVAGAATIELSINREKTVVDFGELSANMACTAAIGGDVPVGALLLVKAASDSSARTITFGEGFTSPTMAGTTSKTKAMAFMYDGTSFVATAAAVQLD
jgi:hypothetical protein